MPLCSGYIEDSWDSMRIEGLLVDSVNDIPKYMYFAGRYPIMSFCQLLISISHYITLTSSLAKHGRNINILGWITCLLRVNEGLLAQHIGATQQNHLISTAIEGGGPQFCLLFYSMTYWPHLIGGLEHGFYLSIQLGIIIPADELHHFSEGYNVRPPSYKLVFKPQ